MFTDLIAEQMRLPERDRDLLRWAAILHDIGKLRVPVSILNKPGKPDEDEWAALQAHPSHGADIAGALLPWLGEWGQVIVEHHERWDGTGYPHGLAGREIHLGSRIVSVADAFDVMTVRARLQASGVARRRVPGADSLLRHAVRPRGGAGDGLGVRAAAAAGTGTARLAGGPAPRRHPCRSRRDAGPGGRCRRRCHRRRRRRRGARDTPAPAATPAAAPQITRSTPAAESRQATTTRPETAPARRATDRPGPRPPTAVGDRGAQQPAWRRDAVPPPESGRRPGQRADADRAPTGSGSGSRLGRLRAPAAPAPAAPAPAAPAPAASAAG